MRFADENVLREWTMRVLEVLGSQQDVATGAEGRPVIFVPLAAKGSGLVYAYVSDSARGFASGLARGVDLEGIILPLRELPDGLTVLVGDGRDAEAYERRMRKAP